MGIEQLHERATEILTTPPNGLLVTIDAAISPDPAANSVTFSVFSSAHLQTALLLAAHFMSLANERSGDEALEAVLDAAAGAIAVQNAELVKYALMVFITHHPEGRRLPIPPLAQRSPTVIVPSKQTVAANGLQALGALGAEAQLDYFREDTAVNDHHTKWHVVYPGQGHPDPANPGDRITKDRQGELFWYMHQQMLARYDTERHAFGLGLTVGLRNYRAGIAEGYDANIDGSSNRPADAAPHDLRGYPISTHETFRDRLTEAADAGSFVFNGGSVPITADLLAATLEASVGAVDPPGPAGFGFYGSLHNMGHGILADIEDLNHESAGSGGVMKSTATAVRDPVFFRWHRHIDDLFVRWQERLPPNDFTADVPPVSIRQGLGGAADHDSPDILLALVKDIPGAAAPGFDGAAFGRSTFGGPNWDNAPDTFAVATRRLTTTMKEERLVQGGAVVRKPYLDHEDFVYFFRLENTSGVEQHVTLRVFLAATTFADNRRMWIEMDKFNHRLDANERAVIYRPGRQSAVVRKPARRPSEGPVTLPPGSVDRNYCDCGWPYHLLLPRGAASGMPARLLVMLTDFQEDLVSAEKKCGSMSFCGARDARYPDRRSMGYPFDRRFVPSIGAAIAGRTQFATCDIRIVHQ